MFAMRFLPNFLLALSLGLVHSARADNAGTDPVANLQSRWAEVKYATPAPQQNAAFEALAEAARNTATAHADSAPVQIWTGIVLASQAGAKGGLGALSLVKEARGYFEKTLTLDPRALDGSAYTSLGSLYYQVPGWPLGFGNDKKARELLAQGLAINPQGVDANYFYGDFLRDQGDYAGAEKAFKQALEAAPRPGRELADAGRRKEIHDAPALVESKLASN